ncbi:CsbD family protein [Methylorubrum sp. SB2]|uniref:CsbD family protein n=1 Tax=Methylorubrum subtropicum TaxID=3138812 RepID=UPI00313E8905
MSSLRTSALRGALLGLALAAAAPALADDTPTTAGAVDRLKGLGNEALGSAKRGVGNLTGNEQLKAEGREQKLRGQAQQEQGKAKDTVENALDK